MSSPNSIPYLHCGACNDPLTLDNYPIQSSTCGHSICKQCLKTKISSAESTPPDASGVTRNLYSNCLVCQKPGAFHPKLSKPNLVAACAIDMMKQYAQMLKTKTTRDFNSQNSHNARSTTSISTKQRVFAAEKDVSQSRPAEDSESEKEEDSPHVLSKNISLHESPTAGNVSSAESDGSEDTLEPASPPLKFQGKKVVWVKFDKISQIADLLAINGDTATIRWESGKYIEEVSVDRIEEMDSDNSMARSKRSRRVSTDRYAPNYPAKKSKNQKKLLSH